MAQETADTYIPGLLITGTDTGVGKTLITAGLLRILGKMGVPTSVVKAVQTGCTVAPDGQLVAPDEAVYRLASPDGNRAVRTRTIHRFQPACSPHLAAEMAGASLDLEDLATAVLREVGDRRFVLVEGAGGILVPLNRHATILDLAQRLGFPVLLVADNRLGVINHSLLTVRILRHRGLRAAGIVFTETEPRTAENEFIRRDNPGTVAGHGHIPVLASVPFLPEWNPREETCWSQLDLHLTPLAAWLKEELGT